MAGRQTGRKRGPRAARLQGGAADARRWRRRKEARPAEILTAALAVFAERGFAAARLDDVAARAGITKGTLYLYFDGKEALFKAVVREGLLPNIAAIEAMARDFPGPTVDLVAQVLRAFGRVIAGTDVGAIPKLVIGESGNFPELARFYLDEVIRRGFALLTGVLSRGVARGEIRPLEVGSLVYLVVAPMLVAAVWRHTFERHGGEPLDVATLIETHIDVLRRGLAAGTSAGDPP
jgi:AcrR family transcriptional regulator